MLWAGTPRLAAGLLERGGNLASTLLYLFYLQFVADGVFYAELNELLVRELAEDGYSGVEVRVTPLRTEIIIRATRTQGVLGEWGWRRSRSSRGAVTELADWFPQLAAARMGCSSDLLGTSRL